MKLGDVEFMPFEGAENLAQLVGFAASVKGHDSRLDAISEIGAAVGKFTMEHPEVRAVHSAASWGRRRRVNSERVVSALKDGFIGNASVDACMTISVLHQDVYERIRSGRHKISGGTKCPPRVFISHTSKTKDDENWVTELALYLIGQRNPGPAQQVPPSQGDGPAPMDVQRARISWPVIIISSEAYKAKAEGRQGGVGWETNHPPGRPSPAATRHHKVSSCCSLRVPERWSSLLPQDEVRFPLQAFRAARSISGRTRQGTTRLTSRRKARGQRLLSIAPRSERPQELGECPGLGREWNSIRVPNARNKWSNKSAGAH